MNRLYKVGLSILVLCVFLVFIGGAMVFLQDSETITYDSIQNNHSSAAESIESGTLHVNVSVENNGTETSNEYRVKKDGELYLKQFNRNGEIHVFENNSTVHWLLPNNVTRKVSSNKTSRYTAKDDFTSLDVERHFVTGSTQRVTRTNDKTIYEIDKSLSNVDVYGDDVVGRIQGSMTIKDSGLVESYSFTLTISNHQQVQFAERYTITAELNDIGGTTVERPEWADRAVHVDE